MPSLSDDFDAVAAALFAAYGRPRDEVRPTGPFESLIQVLLERSMTARKARALIAALRDAGLLDPAELESLESLEWNEVLRSAGSPPSAGKALAVIRRLSAWYRRRNAEERLAEIPVEALREELASIRGLGPSTADALLLHALRKPVYPLDRATYRVLVRHRWSDVAAAYDEAREVVEAAARGDAETLTDLSHWMDRVGFEFCRPSEPRCASCPLQSFLPGEGPVAIEPVGD